MAEPTISVQERQAKVLVGAELLLALKLKEANEYFEKIKGEHPHYLVMHTITLYVDSIQNHAGNKSKEDSIHKLINNVLKSVSTHSHIQDDLLSFNRKVKPTGLEMQQFSSCQLIAFMLLIKASIQIRRQSYIKAGASFRKSWKFYEECHKIITEEKSEESIDPEYLYDVLFGIGVFSFVISLVPPAFTFFVEAIGFKGDRGKGFNLLKECAERQTWTGFVSLIILQLLYQFYFEDSNRALKVNVTITERFPNAIVPLFANGYTLRFMGEIDQAEATFEKLYAAADQFKQLRLSCLYEIGSTAVKRSDWTKAIEHINGYLKGNPPEGYRCYAAYEIGVCYCFVKEYDKAIVHFKKSVEWVRNEYAFDVFAARKSKQYLDYYKSTKVLLSPFELIHFEAKERFKVMKYDSALEILMKKKELKKGTLTPDDRAVYYLLYGELLRKRNETEKAQKKFEKASREKVKHEAFVPPHAFVELAKIAIHLNKQEEAKKYLKIAKEDYKGYDFNAQLLRTITRLHDKLSGVNYGAEVTD